MPALVLFRFICVVSGGSSGRCASVSASGDLERVGENGTETLLNDDARLQQDQNSSEEVELKSPASPIVPNAESKEAVDDSDANDFGAGALSSQHALPHISYQ